MINKRIVTPILIDSADPAFSIEEAIQILVDIGEYPPEAKRQVMVARGLWQPRGRIVTTIVDGETISFQAD
jgi:hypothetical protein